MLQGLFTTVRVRLDAVCLPVKNGCLWSPQKRLKVSRTDVIQSPTRKTSPHHPYPVEL